MRDINLLPEEMLKHNKSKIANQLFSIVIICLCIMIVSYLSITILDYINKRENVAVTSEIKDLEHTRATQENIEKMKKEITSKEKEALKITNANTNYYLLMKDIEKLVPQGIQFTEQVSEEGKMTISGIAQNDQEVSEFTARLHNLKGAKNVWIESTKYMDQIQFQVSFVYAENGGNTNEPQ